MKKIKIAKAVVLAAVLGFILAGCTNPTGGAPPTVTAEQKAAELAADLNARKAGIATVEGATVKLGFMGINSDLTVPAGVTLDVTADGAALILRNTILTVNGTVNAGPNAVRLEDSANTATINGSGTIRLNSKGHLFEVSGNGNVADRKLTLDGVTLVGLKDNNEALVFVRSGGVGHTGTFVMKSGKITGNTNTRDGGTSGGGVIVREGGTFIMDGGEISGNTAQSSGDWADGGGVGVHDNAATFTMSGGTISGNTAIGMNSGGGGVSVNNGAIFTLEGGTISGNTVQSSEDWCDGGGVEVRVGATFTMSGGTITSNTAIGGKGANGGGVDISDDSTFTMEGGTISGNTAKGGEGANGGGVFIGDGSTFTMEGGTISGNTVQSGGDNNANGGGVFIGGGSTFTMEGGTISGNTAKGVTAYSGGGGVSVNNAGSLFTMTSGIISGNTAQSGGGAVGGGVWVNDDATFTMEDGMIYGSALVANAGDNANETKDGGGVPVTTGSATIMVNSGTVAKWGTGGAICSTDDTLIATP
jgi:hypothetical protein